MQIFWKFEKIRAQRSKDIQKVYNFIDNYFESVATSSHPLDTVNSKLAQFCGGAASLMDYILDNIGEWKMRFSQPLN